MKTILAAAFAAALAMTAAAEDGAAEEFGKALDKETNDRDPAGALEMYRKIVGAHKADEEIAAKSQYRIGECLEKLGKADEAKAAYEAVGKNYPGQTEIVRKAKDRLAGIGGQAGPKEEDDGSNVAKKLAVTKIDLDFTDSTLYDIVDFVQEFAKVSVIVDPAAAEQAGKQFSFRVKDLTLDKTLNLIAASTELDCVNRKGILFFTTQERAAHFREAPELSLPKGAPEDDRKVFASLKAIRISLNFGSTPLEETMNFIREVSDLNIVLAEDVKERTITLKVEDQSMFRVFDTLALLADLDVSIRDGVVFIKNR